MSILLDLLGALMIASLLMLMMISFQFQLQDIANRTMFSAQMMVHEQEACEDLNRLVALVGIGVAPDSTVSTATATSATFRTRWSYVTNQMLLSPTTLQLTLEAATASGRRLRIVQGPTVVNDLANILWIEDLAFVYYDKAGALVALPTTATTIKTIRSMDVNMTFMRRSPRANKTPLRTRVSLRIYFMNCFLQGG